ncbi:heterokaryon incompatibility, partial [Lentithecium fluviatile CBS 122367]
PQTIRDAILMTRSLGVFYLWIDALCIIQGSDDRCESARMADVYGNACFAIIAARTKSVNDGFFGP